MVLEETLESPLDCKEIQAVHPKGDQSWVFIGRTDVEAETPVLPHAKMGKIKDRSGMDLTEAEDIKKRWQEYTELYKKDLHDTDNTHLEPDIVECESVP